MTEGNKPTIRNRRDRLNKIRLRGKTLTTSWKKNVAPDKPSSNENQAAKPLDATTLSKSLTNINHITQQPNECSKHLVMNGSIKGGVAAFQKNNLNKSSSPPSSNNNCLQSIESTTRQDHSQKTVVTDYKRDIVLSNENKHQLGKENFSSFHYNKKSVLNVKKHAPIGPSTTSSQASAFNGGVLGTCVSNDIKLTSWNVKKEVTSPIGSEREESDEMRTKISNNRINSSWRKTTMKDLPTSNSDQINSIAINERKSTARTTQTQQSHDCTLNAGVPREQILSNVTNDENNGSWRTPTKSARTIVNTGVSHYQMCTDDRKNKYSMKFSRDPGTNEEVSHYQIHSNDINGRKNTSLTAQGRRSCTSVTDVRVSHKEILPYNEKHKSPEKAVLDDASDNDASDFSFANLHSMWLQRDTQPMEIMPPTATAPLHYQTASPESNNNSFRKHVSFSTCKENENTSKTGSISGGRYSYEIRKALFKTNSNNLNVMTECNDCLDKESSPDLKKTVENVKLTSRQKKTIDKKQKNEKGQHGNLKEFRFCSHQEPRLIEDPYMNFDSMSTAYSEVTLQAQNVNGGESQTCANSDPSKRLSGPSSDEYKTRLKSKESKNDEQKEDSSINLTDDNLESDSDIESDSIIPDSAFGLDKNGSNVAYTNSLSHNKEGWIGESNIGGNLDNRDNQAKDDKINLDSAVDFCKSQQQYATKPLTAQSISALSKTLTTDVQQTPRPMSVVESDVFDGISEIASSINLSFTCRATSKLASSLNKNEEKLKINTDNGSIKQSEVEGNMIDNSKALKSNLPSKIMSALSDNPQDSEIIEKKHSVHSTNQKNEVIRKMKQHPWQMKDSAIKVCEAQANGKTLSSSAEKTDDQSFDQPHPYGITPLLNLTNLNDSIRSSQQDQLSFHLQLLTNESSRNNHEDSISDWKKKRNNAKTESCDVSIGSKTGSTDTKSSVQYPQVREEIPDTLSSVRWVPSMVRLYGKKISIVTTDVLRDNNQENLGKEIETPSEIKYFNWQYRGKGNKFDILQPVNDKLLNLKQYELTGVQTLSLYKNDTFGGSIEDPSSIVLNALKLQDLSRSTHDLGSPQTELIRPGLMQKCMMSERALQIHNEAMAYLESDDVENAMELYENFLKNKNDFQLVNELTENQIIGAFLHNIGILHTMVGDFDLSVNFLQQAISFRGGKTQPNTIEGRDIAVILNEMGIAYFANGQHEDALKVFADALSIWQNFESNVSCEMTKVLNNIGCTYFVLNETDAALEAMSESLEIQRSFLIESIVKKMNCSNEIVAEIKRSLLAVSEIMCNMAHLFVFTRSMKEVSFLLEKAALIQKKIFGGQCRKELLRLIYDQNINDLI